MYKCVNYITVILALLSSAVALAEPSVTPSTNDPMVMKIYPDGTKVVVRWSEIGKAVDNGEKHGGAPRIIAYEPGKDGIVPIGQPAATVPTPSSTPTPMPSSTSVVTPESSNGINTTQSPMSDTYDYGPMEGFGFLSNVGVAFQQSQSGRVNDRRNYQSVTFQPGIRFDIEPFYNVTDWFSVGVESAFIYNQIHSIQINNSYLFHRFDLFLKLFYYFFLSSNFFFLFHLIRFILLYFIFSLSDFLFIIFNVFLQIFFIIF
jgi:hypothetical protein